MKRFCRSLARLSPAASVPLFRCSPLVTGLKLQSRVNSGMPTRQINMQQVEEEMPTFASFQPLDMIYDEMLAALQESNKERLHSATLSLHSVLEHHQSVLSNTEWKEWIANEFVPHRIFQYLSTKDAVCGRSLEKPRGYAGDAALLDLLYFDCSDQDLIESMLIQINQALSPVAQRAEFLGGVVDNLLSNITDGSKWSALSVASGHCREAEYCQLLKDESTNGNINVVAFDQDPLSLDVVRDRSEAAFNGCIQTCEGKVGSLINPKYVNKLLNGYNNGDKFDCIWSMGLYDYLSEPFAVKLTSSLFNDYLKNGGVLCFANMVDGWFYRGYLEAQMDWWLIYRSMEEMKTIVAKAIPQSQISIETYTNLYGVIVVQIKKESNATQSDLEMNNYSCLKPLI